MQPRVWLSPRPRRRKPADRARTPSGGTAPRHRGGPRTSMPPSPGCSLSTSPSRWTCGQHVAPLVGDEQLGGRGAGAQPVADGVEQVLDPLAGRAPRWRPTRGGWRRGALASAVWSALLKARSSGSRPAPISSRTMRTASIWPSGSCAVASTTWTSRSASATTSSVDLKASTSRWGSLRTKPTVSVSSTGSPPGSSRRRVVGSRVANSRSSTSTPASVSRLSSVDLPAFV